MLASFRRTPRLLTACCSTVGFGSHVGSQENRRQPTPVDTQRTSSQVTDLNRRQSTRRGHLRIRRLGIRVPPSALGKSLVQGWSNRNSSCGATPSNSLSPTVGMVDSGAPSTPPAPHQLIRQLRRAAVGQPGAPRTQPGQIAETGYGTMFEPLLAR